jgi:surface protein
MQVIQINSLTGHSPYDITICDITNTYCYSGVTGVTTAPLTINLPSELLGTNEVIVVVTDSIGCQEIQYHNCGVLSPTPTPTPTPTITPTNITCNCISIENPFGIILNFGFTQCDGSSFYGQIYSGTTLYVCGKSPYGDSGLVITTSSEICIGNICAGPTPTPTTTPTPTPTLPAVVGYFQDSCNPSYEFTLSNIPVSFSPLSGAYYVESSGYVGCATYIGSTTSTNVFSFVAMGSQPSINHCQVANFIYPCPTQTPTPSVTSTLTPTPTPTVTNTPTNTITPTPTSSMNYSVFKVVNCCSTIDGQKIIKFISLPHYFLPGTAVVDINGNCWSIISVSYITPNEFWNYSITYIDCELCIKYQTCLPTPLPSFISTWTTTSPSESITLPYETTGTYSGTIDWGDGIITTNSYSNRIHTYTTPGTYTITITGVLNGWSFLIDGTNAYNITEVIQWGCLRLGNSGGYFSNCYQLSLSNVVDVLNLTGTNNLFEMFSSCTNLSTIPFINSWDTSNVTNMSFMFGFSSFNQNIIGWDVSNVTNMSNMFYVTPFNQILSSWEVSNVTNMSNMFAQTPFDKYINSWDVSSVTDMSDMFRNSNFNQPLVDWDVSNVTNMSNMFAQTPFDQNINSWDVSNVTNMSFMFFSTPYNQSLSLWDVSNVTNMSGMFWQTTLFNQPIEIWDVSNVTNMSYMFSSALVFDQPIDGWDVSNVTNMFYMFDGAPLFNQPLNNWDTSNVTTMYGMFKDTSLFNQDIGSWDVSSVINMTVMFQGFNTPNVFNNGGSPSISAWTPSSVTSMFGMFNSNNSFNQDIGNWDVSNVNDFSGMFLVSPFNNGGSPSISGWTINTTSNVNMYWMFRLSPFNQPIGSWNVSKVTNMESMFHSAFSFNQDIGGWNVSGVTNFTNFMAAKTFSDYSTTNLDSIYNGWSSLPSVQTNRNITFNTIKYTAGGSAGKAILQGTYGWTITDGGI